MEEFQYRRMLNDISQNIRADQLDSLKFLCRSFDIPVRRLEAMESALDVWIALEEKEKLGSKNTALLKELLRDREDLLKIVDSYEAARREGCEQERRSSQNNDLEEEFEFLSENLGKDWRKLARKMKLNESDIAAIEEKYPRNLPEQIRATLLRWAAKNDNKITKEDLINILKSCQLNMLVHQLQTLSQS